MEGLTFSMELRGKARVVWGVWEEEVAIRQSGWLAFAREWCRSPQGKHLQRNHKSSPICNTHGHNASTNLIGSISHSCSTTALEGTEMTLASERAAGARDRKDSPIPSPHWKLPSWGVAGTQWWKGPGCEGESLSWMRSQSFSIRLG